MKKLFLVFFTIFLVGCSSEQEPELRVVYFLADNWTIQEKDGLFWRDITKALTFEREQFAIYSDRDHPVLFSNFDDAAKEAKRLSIPGELIKYKKEQDKIWERYLKWSNGQEKGKDRVKYFVNGEEVK